MSALDGLYQQLILDHSKKRFGDGLLEHHDAQHFERNPSCGDEITLQLALEPGTDTVAALGWTGAGCSISMASASVLSEMAPGMSVDELRALIGEFREMLRSRGAGEPDDEVLGDAVAFHGVSKFVMRIKCAMLAWVATEACLLEVRPAA
ncbi:Fe-S cluster assembly sulfur transfer protein SufU [Microterricola pindariensis]|uniref:SUF system NifU family Fe-S cluster assembly protein n=1 Tax=Microterricola pindariensis TaxID=478010 RepID=A0ABX5AZ35_9MICO|nr:SUF system NifU family Fe-S cluster assembly protein [Microterricola pindariensis]PPL19609.1 SUF system NifU family Fe-S cluster assembly protein [Microterricola pindariensis]